MDDFNALKKYINRSETLKLISPSIYLQVCRIEIIIEELENGPAGPEWLIKKINNKFITPVTRNQLISDIDFIRNRMRRKITFCESENKYKMEA